MAAKEAHHAQEMAAVRTEYGLDVVTPPSPLVLLERIALTI
jgi:hypothetical protein